MGAAQWYDEELVLYHGLDQSKYVIFFEQKKY